MRRIGYRTVVNAFAFTGLWFVLGLVLLWTPVPHALGIRGQMFVAWLMLFFAMLAVAGLMLMLAALNGMFPRVVRAPRRAETLWAAPPDPIDLPRRPSSRPRAESRPAKPHGS